MTTKWGARHARMIRHATKERPAAGEPAFIVQIESNYNGNGRLLKWGDVPPMSKEVHKDVKHYGYFAAYPITIHDGGKLIEGEPEVAVPPEGELEVVVPRALLEQVLETFRTGIIQDETLDCLHKALK